MVQVKTTSMPESEPAVLREVFRDKLQRIVSITGSVKFTAELIGVNRTQFNRYLNGTSMPRPDMLYQLCRKLDVPMEWFFDASTDFPANLTAHRIGARMRRIVQGKRFSVDAALLPDGFYRIWKATFEEPLQFESFLSTVKTINGHRQMRTLVPRRPTKGEIAKGWRSRYFPYDCLMMRSSNGLFILASEGLENHLFTYYLRQRASLQLDSAGVVFAGAALSAAYGFPNRAAAVPAVMEQLTGGTGPVLKAARRAGLIEQADLPGHVARLLAECQVPDFRLY